MKKFIEWFTTNFDRTDLLLIAGLIILYFALQSSDIPNWIPGTLVGGVFVAIAVLGIWRQ